MKIYLDNCTLNRPFDDQKQIRIHIESEAKLYIQNKLKENKIELVWSYILDYENEQNPYEERKRVIGKWKKIAKEDIEEDKWIIQKAKELQNTGLHGKDALHVACAIKAKAEYFITTDDLIIRSMNNNNEINVINPVDFIKEIEE